MNIAFFVTKFPSLSETFIANQVIALQNTGHTVHIFSQQRPPAKEKVHQMITDAGLLKNTFYLSDISQSRIGKIKTLLFKLISNAPRKSFQIVYCAVFKNRSNLSVYELVHFLDKPEYNVLHAHFGPNGNYVTELLKLGLYSKAKFITTFHGYDLDQKLKENNFYSSLFSACSLFTVNTNYSKNLLVKLGCEENKIKVLPVRLDACKFKKSNVDNHRDNFIRLLFVGRLVKFKAPNLVIEICSILKETNNINFTAKIIGDGPMLQELEELLNQKQLLNEVEILAGKTQEEIKEIMNESDLFIFPGITFNSRSENQGLVIQEAQAMQLPVLISDAGGMAEGIQEGVSGYVLKQNDLLGFVEKIELLANDPDLRKKMGEEGRKLIEAKYDIMVLNQKLINLHQY